MFRKLILSQSKLIQRPQMLHKQVLHMSGKKDGKLDKSIQQQPVIAECICPPMTHYKVLTMDDMQLPYGNWKKQHEKRNKSYNIVLLFGLASLIGSIKVLTDSVFFNAFAPPYPFDKVIEDIFECAEDDEECEFECECEC